MGEQKFRILLVDDNKYNIDFLKSVLEILEECEILEAYSGKDALEIVKTNQIDLILLDIQMSVMDGYEVASILKSDRETKDIPIIFITALFKEEEFEKKGFEIGAIDYFKKPIDTFQLINKIKMYIKLLKNQRELKWNSNHLEEIVEQRNKELILMNKKLEEEVLKQKTSENRLIKLNRLYSTLSMVNEIIVRTNEKKKLFTEICRILVEIGQFEMVWIGIIDEKTFSVKPLVSYGNDRGYTTNLKLSVLDVPEGMGPTGIAIRDSKDYIVNDIETNLSFLQWKDEATKRGYCSMAVFPIRRGFITVGVLALYSKEKFFFDDNEVNLLEKLVNNISYAYTSIEIEEQHKEAVENLQKSQEKYRMLTENLIKMNKELINAKSLADENSRLKTEFVRNISHELKTPMNSIIGFSQLVLKENNLSDNIKENIQFIYDSAKVLSEEIDNILDLSKMDIGTFSIRKEKFNLKDLINDITEYFYNLSEKKNLDFKINGIVDKNIYTDKLNLRKILINLIDNAIKFTIEGSVRLEIKMTLDNYLKFAISDTGIGIPIEKQHLLFNPFVQVDSSMTRQFEGSGLGLFLSKKIVEALGGNITFTSKEGVGTTFEFSVKTIDMD